MTTLRYSLEIEVPSDDGRDYWHGVSFENYPKWWTCRDSATRAIESYITRIAGRKTAQPNLVMTIERVIHEKVSASIVSPSDYPAALLTGYYDRTIERGNMFGSSIFWQFLNTLGPRFEAMLLVHAGVNDVKAICQTPFSTQSSPQGLMVGLTSTSDALLIRAAHDVRVSIDLGPFWVAVAEKYPGLRDTMGDTLCSA